MAPKESMNSGNGTVDPRRATQPVPVQLAVPGIAPTSAKGFGYIPGGRPEDVVSELKPVSTPSPAISPTPPLPSTAGREIAFDGRRNLGDDEAAAAGKAIGTKVNPATGLPFGYLPGNAIPAGADQGMKDRAAASVSRQQAASFKAMTSPQPAAPKPQIPALTRPDPTQAVRDSIPGGPSLEEGWAKDRANQANYDATQKRIAANGNGGLQFKNNGAKVPLDQIVANNYKPKIPSISPTRIPRRV